MTTTPEQTLATRLRAVASSYAEPPAMSPTSTLTASLLREVASALEHGILTETQVVEAVAMVALAVGDLSSAGASVAREAFRRMAQRVPRLSTPYTGGES